MLEEGQGRGERGWRKGSIGEGKRKRIEKRGWLKRGEWEGGHLAELFPGRLNM